MSSVRKGYFCYYASRKAFNVIGKIAQIFISLLKFCNQTITHTKNFRDGKKYELAIIQYVA